MCFLTNKCVVNVVLIGFGDGTQGLGRPKSSSSFPNVTSFNAMRVGYIRDGQPSPTSVFQAINCPFLMTHAKLRREYALHYMYTVYRFHVHHVCYLHMCVCQNVGSGNSIDSQ